MTDENLSCPQCPKSFSSTKLLQQHQQMFHTDKSVLIALKQADAPVGMERAFICETCGKAFRFRSNLAEHRSVHTALKPYVCKFCGKSSRLKGNLTKHILKHHKKEQNEAIAKDDIIVKKAPKVKQENGTTTNGTSPNGSTTATATAVITSASTGTNGTHHNNNNNSHAINNNHRQIKMEIEDPEYISMAVTKASVTPVVAKVVATSSNSTPRSRPQPKENNNTVVTTVTTPTLVVPSFPEEVCQLPKDVTTDSERYRSILISLGLDFGNSIPVNNEKIAQAVRDLKRSSPDSETHLPIHMTMSHGYPPPEDAQNDAEEEEECDDSNRLYRNGLNVEKELKRISSAIAELREAQSNTPKIEDIKALITIDTRVGKLEKSLETALNSIYTLVQLQSGMTSSVNRLREDSAKHFAELKSQLNMVYTPQRISRRNSIRSESVSRDRSRSPL
ncbi:hypothetical protein CAEBREN_06490 [Caenorhabditis brenneri]|uniref:C2H2-type domain-containing protein n=1 Tax=Caenorhabditis brenneri TaxID=135651 RepID=G0N521_CAEBE|nr:hypothetical protein CAEBREN_06490 [Caenorhabditis brenneri]